MCAPAFVCAPVPMEAAEGFGRPRTEVTTVCELPDLGARNQTWLLCRHSKHT